MMEKQNSEKLKLDFNNNILKDLPQQEKEKEEQQQQQQQQ